MFPRRDVNIEIGKDFAQDQYMLKIHFDNGGAYICYDISDETAEDIIGFIKECEINDKRASSDKNKRIG